MEEKFYDVIIVGTGPNGIFTAIELINKTDNLSILMLEKGNDITKRSCPMNGELDRKCQNCSSCSIVSGWGGAGAFSDGKLSLSPNVGGNLDEYIGREQLEEYIDYCDDIYLDFGAPDRIFGVSESKKKEIKEKAIKANLKFKPTKLRHLGTG